MEILDRKWARATRAAVTGLLVSASAALAASHAETNMQAKPADLVARGEYLATITGCGDCHTPGTFYGAPDGAAVLPPMPWPDFAAMTDDDVKAIVAYLRSVPPIRHAVPAVIPPGKPVTGAYLTFPPPPAWDAPRTPPAGAPPAAAPAAK